MNKPGEGTEAIKNPKQPLGVGIFAVFSPDEAMPKDRGLYPRRRIGVMALCAAWLGILWGASQSRDFVENVYAEGFSQLVSRGLATVSGLLPTSLAEVVLVFSLAWLLIPAGVALLHVLRRKRRILNAIAAGGLRFGAFALVALALFYTFWGLNYSRAPLRERLALEQTVSDPEAHRRLLAETAAVLVEATNEAYFMATAAEDIGVPSSPLLDSSGLAAEIDEGYRRVTTGLALDSSFAHSRGEPKPMAASVALTAVGVAGFYFPWTGEANYNRQVPGCQLPLVMAHESAHQRCIALEDEANFFGCLACLHADNPYVRYSGLLFAQRQILMELLVYDREAALELVKTRLPGVQRDVDAVRDFWLGKGSAAGKIGNTVGETVNNAFLKGNGVKQGVRSYQMSGSLLFDYFRKHGIKLYKPAEPSPETE